jgi:DNA repair protein SbcD/Mre11
MGKCVGGDEMTEMHYGDDAAGAMQQKTDADADQQNAVGENVGEQGEQIVTVVFTADNHLGYTAFGQQPKKREERQQRLRAAFQQATDFAVGQGVDLFMQGGDLFDSTTPDEQDRSFVAARLAQLRQANVRVFALGGTHDTPAAMHMTTGKEASTAGAPQLSYARLGALTYLAPDTLQLEPIIIDIHGVRVGICGRGVLADQSGDPLARMYVTSDIERAAIPLLLLHAPIEGFASQLDSRAQVRRESIERQSAFRYILAGYHHTHHQLHLGQCDLIVAGATQHIGFDTTGETPGFVFLGLDKNGIRWCKHIAVNSLALRNLVISTRELWPPESNVGARFIAPDQQGATDAILTRLRPLCDGQTMVQLRLEGALTRRQYHQLDLNRLRRFGEEHAFALAIDDSDLELLSESETASAETAERFSPRAELIALADEWIAAASDEQEKQALRATREELLAAMDEVGARFIAPNGSNRAHRGPGANP